MREALPAAGSMGDRVVLGDGLKVQQYLYINIQYQGDGLKVQQYLKGTAVPLYQDPISRRRLKGTAVPLYQHPIYVPIHSMLILLDEYTYPALFVQYISISERKPPRRSPRVTGWSTETI